jgi:predicted MPP superfamily phosphohydrolase
VVSLYEVCVWESFPAGVTVDTDGSWSVCFTTECNGTCEIPIVPINKDIRFGSTGDPLNGLTVTWRSGGTSDSIAWGYTTNLEEGVYHGFKRDHASGIMFDYTFTSLTAASTIHYAIFDSKDSVWTEEKTFNTASGASNNQFSFTALGDSRSDMNQWHIVSEAILETDFTLFLGDIIQYGGNHTQWDDWFEYGEKFIAKELVYHTIGNHDEDDSPSGYDNYLNLFTLPGNELYYSFTYGNAIFICLNTQDPGNAEQYSWLESTLQANKDQTWKFVFFHKPYYTSPSHEGEMDDYFETWWKAFDDYGVDMIFNGHTHNYQRTKPINRNISTTSTVANYGSDEGMGRCQIVSGGAGVHLSLAAIQGLWWLKRSESKHHFCNIDIDGRILTFKAIDSNQAVFDVFTIDKRWPIGTSDLRNTSSWIYPNPTNDLLTIETDKPDHYSIEIHSLNGQLIYSTRMDGPTHQIDLSSFEKGLYFITVRSRDYVRTEKIIKQ